MMRRTRRQIEEGSSLISGAFNDIRTQLGTTELEDEILREELSVIVLERVGEGAFDGTQKTTLWQIATEDDVEQLKEKYLPMKQSAEDLVDNFQELVVAQKSVGAATADDADIKIGISQEERRDSETKSDHSNKISLNLLSSRIGKLSQTLGFGINRQNGKVEFEVEFGTQRPGGVQDRHISAYMLMLEVFKSRLTGMEVENAIEAIPEIVKEYIEDSPGMRQFLDYARQQQDLLAMQGVLTKEERKQVYEIECATLGYLQTYAHSLEERLKDENSKPIRNSDLVEFLEKSLKDHQDILTQEKEKWEIISPMDARNKYKEADLWKYQECFANTLKAAVVTMNKMEMVSFAGQETASDRGTQGQAIKEAAARLRDRDVWDVEIMNRRKVAEDIVTLFDYPRQEIDSDKSSPEIVTKLFNRHVKLVYDSFEGFRNLDESNLKDIISDSFNLFKSRQGWPTKKREFPYPNSHENIDLESRTSALPEKFHALKSRSLTSAIKELEAQVKAGIEDQVEEEQSQSRDSQEGVKSSAQSASKKSAGGGR